MDKYYYKIIKYMINNPNLNVDDIRNHFKFDDKLFDMIMEKLNNIGYISICLGMIFDVNISGYEFVKSYHSNQLKSIFRDYIFQIILSLLSFGLGLLSGLILK